MPCHTKFAQSKSIHGGAREFKDSKHLDVGCMSLVSIAQEIGHWKQNSQNKDLNAVGTRLGDILLFQDNLISESYELS